MNVNEKLNYLIDEKLFSKDELSLALELKGLSHNSIDEICFIKYDFDFNGLIFENKRRNFVK